MVIDKVHVGCEGPPQCRCRLLPTPVMGFRGVGVKAHGSVRRGCREDQERAAERKWGSRAEAGAATALGAQLSGSAQGRLCMASAWLLERSWPTSS